MLALQLSNTMGANFFVAAHENTSARDKWPDIINTALGSQLNNIAFIITLRDVGIRISMAGQGRWSQNASIRTSVCRL